MTKPLDYEQSFPSALWDSERVFLSARRGPDRPVEGDRPPPDVTGVALSGGGIRSATFCLGVFQALAHHHLLDRIDYLSTVSGGGYFGSFLGGLFARPEIGEVGHVEAVLQPDGARPSPTASAAAPALGLPDVLRWLRENGRYLSPNGSGDLLVGGAIMFRNWIAIHVVLVTLAVMCFLVLQSLRGMLALTPIEAVFTPLSATPTRGHAVWWSPFIALPLIPLLLVAVPTAWAYWLVRATRQKKDLANPLVGFGIAALLAGGLTRASDAGTALRMLGLVVLGEVVLALAAWCLAWRRAQAVAADAAVGGVNVSEDEGFVASEEKNLLSHWLLAGLVLAGAALVVGLVDSIGQTLYVALSGTSLVQATAGLFAALAGAASVGRRIAVALGRGVSGGKRLKLSTSVLAGLSATAIIGGVLLAVDVFSHALAWRFETPALAPWLSWAGPPDVHASMRAVRDVQAVSMALALAFVLSLVFGRSWQFLNGSSLHAMYSARLTRAYLGASNPRRASGAGEAVTRVRPGDNFSAADYWAAPGAGTAPCEKGAPLHLINVTVNETVDGRSQIQQQDRKGMGMAIGPCALSVGARHHAVFPSHAALRFGAAPTVAPAAGTHRVFESVAGAAGPEWRGGERLTVGQWVGISGAAFSTGLGARTSLGLSLLCGFANVRLGYWWESGVEPAAPSAKRRPVEWLFPLQTFLLKEFVSQFPGTAYRRWYLSDGGHFENMGGYELIRRRLPRMLIVDAEADPEYTFEGLANLVRKARLDFGAEIQFLSAAELDSAVPETHRHLFGPLEELRRGRWGDEPVNDPVTRGRRLTIDQPVDQTRYSRAHAALGRVTWSDDPEHAAWLVYLKPTLTGDEPTDVLEYHRGHAPFPQETTSDQFFDEAQWESYRMLGFLIADAVFAPGPAPAVGATEGPASPSPRSRIFG